MDDLLGIPVVIKAKDAKVEAAETKRLMQSVTNPKTYIVHSCITCQRAVLFNPDPQVLEVEADGDDKCPITSLFCITICAACEQKENEDWSKDPNDSIWTHISIHKDYFSFIQPFLAMNAYISSIGEYLRLELCENRLPLRHRNTIKDLMDGEYNVNTLLVRPTEDVLTEVFPYIEKGLFKAGEH
jgi:hypothetical protein